MDFDYGDEFGWEDDFRSNRYADAYGDYRGGYRAPAPGPRGPAPPLGWGPMPRGPPPSMFGGPPTIFGRGFPGGPSARPRAMEDSAIKYLIRCGVPRENLKGLPRSILSMISPDNCGLCSQRFDSFSISRVHYLSKNHMKNQKKFLMNTQGPQKNQEAPIKARELYCELCDVQITSKVHADSHYAGKSHRAVVIGRKNPKNPVLLQPGMERRMMQLIRREKKFLKEVPEDDKEKVKDVKPIQPELYCVICNTSVTCSEQMTAHMNGKRHLTKEKQYILKQMRGDSMGNGNGDEEDEGGNAIKDEANADADADGDTEAGAGAGADADAEGAQGEDSGTAAAAPAEDWTEDWH